MIQCPACAAPYAFSPELLGDQVVDVRCPRCAAPFALDRDGVRRPLAGVLRRRRAGRSETATRAASPLARLELIAARPADAGEGGIIEVAPTPRPLPPRRRRTQVRMPRRHAAAPRAGITALPVAHGRRRWSALEVDPHPPRLARATQARARPPLAGLLSAIVVIVGSATAAWWPGVEEARVEMAMASQPAPTPQVASLIEPIEPATSVEPEAPVVAPGEVVRRGDAAIAFGLVINESEQALTGARVEAVLMIDGRPMMRRVVRCCEGLSLAQAEAILEDSRHPRPLGSGAGRPLAGGADAAITVIFQPAPSGDATVRMRLLPTE